MAAPRRGPRPSGEAGRAGDRRTGGDDPARSEDPQPGDSLVAAAVRPEDPDVSLRPRCLADYVGQQRLKENLAVFIEASRVRGEAMDHVLLHGAPGLGKTTLAHVIAAERGVRLRTTSGPAIERPGDLAALLTNLDAFDVLFIDEIHRLPTIVEETLYPAMEDFHLELIVGQGPAARAVKYPLPPFTLIGATTRVGLLTAPLRTRFGSSLLLEPYSEDELLAILQRSARILGVDATPDGLREVARRSRGAPRIANRLLRRVRDYADVAAQGLVDAEMARATLEKLQVDHLGLDRADRRLLATMLFKFRGGPVGLSTLGAALGEEKDTLEDIQEPYLIRLGFLERTPRGRCLTPAGREHARELGGQGGVAPEARQPELFQD